MEQSREGGPARRLAPRGILAAVYAGRLCLAAAIFLAAANAWDVASPESTLAATLMLVVAAATTAAAVWYTHVRDQWPSAAFLYGQVVLDAVLVTGAILLTGAETSMFVPLYVLVICAAALVLHLRGALLAAALCGVLYLGLLTVRLGDEPDVQAVFQILLFLAVAAVTGAVAQRMRDAGELLGQVQGELRRLRLDTAEILGSVGTGVLTVDEDGCLVYINPAAGELLGIDTERWLGEPVIPLLEEVAPTLGESLSRTVSGAPVARRELMRPDGTFLGFSTAAVGGDHGTPRAVTAMFQDITERRRSEVLSRRAERLEAVAALGASLAHELKNPLASVRSAAEQLAHGGLEHDDRDVLRRLVIRESERLSHLLNDFIDFARVQVQSTTSVEIGELAQQAAELVRAHPDARGCELEVEVNGTAAEREVTGERELLNRAVINLLLNATQWAGPGGRVRISVAPASLNGLARLLGGTHAVRIQVSDTGAGIPAEHADRIFDPFFTLRPGGKGLGLAVVQRAVEAHGGVIVLDEAAPGREWTTSFTVYLPSSRPGTLRTLEQHSPEQPFV